MNMTLSLSLISLLSASKAGIAQQQPAGSNVKHGAVLYSENCASCHGANLVGQPSWPTPDENGYLPAPPHDRSGHTWHHGDILLFNYTKQGGQGAMERLGVTGMKSEMPGFESSLSDTDIWGTIAFFKSTWPKREQKIQEMRTQALYTKGNERE
ncbi:c-type cytochrome [Parasedimentitalea maritima]|uniref:C-type cytochrome n=1 Tax=Parasedimentitalea maritima TaxID=2578117 RepID=A0A6A4R6Q4_9RHOB|nr:cytochrome c [Zongyanglinia marina]KAE9625889.1 c-type cytochrome [Zongyanglinia marina]